MEMSADHPTPAVAQRQFSVKEVTEAFAATRGLAMPSQLRHMLRAQGRDLHAEFTRLLPTPPPPIRIQRWSLRRVGLLAVAVVLAVFIVQTIAGSVASDEANATPLYISNVASAGQAPHVLGFRTRAELQEALSQRSDGRLHLDPEDAR
jgi:hypothetical protein